MWKHWTFHLHIKIFFRQCRKTNTEEKDTDKPHNKDVLMHGIALKYSLLVSTSVSIWGLKIARFANWVLKFITLPDQIINSWLHPFWISHFNSTHLYTVCLQLLMGSGQSNSSFKSSPSFDVLYSVRNKIIRLSRSESNLHLEWLRTLISLCYYLCKIILFIHILN